MFYKKIYISTESEFIAKLLLSLFKHSDHMMPEVVQPDCLREKIQNETPSLILLQENFGICNSLKSDEETLPIPIISVINSPLSDEISGKCSADKIWAVGGNVFSLMELIREFIPKEKKRILVADDEHVIHDVIKRILGEDTYEFLDTYTGKEAIDQALDFGPDLIITDITMPELNGFEVCRWVKNNVKTSEIPVMIVSAHTDESIIKKGFEAGADEYITKPFPMEELISKVEYLFTEPIRRRKEKILIVGDSSSIISILKNSISQQGFTVLTANSGDEGFRIAGNENPEVVVSDLEMPGMNGFELCKKLRDLPETKTTPFIALTSRDSRGARGLGKRVGISSYISKPFTAEKVVVIIERFLAERSVMMDLEREMMLASIMALAKALDERDNYTRFHAENVSKLSIKIAESLNMSQSEIERIRLAALLHDIGKIGIRDAILFKPGVLTEEEYRIIQTHPDKGAAILKPIPSLRDIIPFILHHHERYDGKGTPGMLKGEKIPIGARIISVADTYDALTTNRPYRKAMSIEQTLTLIKSLAGTQLCPYIVPKFLKIENITDKP